MLRSCYQSLWSLYRDRPDILVPGRYYFSPPGTPAYPFPHNLGSRNYTSDFDYSIPGLGERGLPAKTHYDKGTRPGVLPLPRMVGSQDCIELGETTLPPANLIINYVPGDNFYQQANPGEFDLGMRSPAGCYEPSIVFPFDKKNLPLYIESKIDPNSRQVQRTICEVIRLSYGGTMLFARNTLINHLGYYTAEVGIDPSGDPINGAVIATNNDFTIIAMPGSTNAGQWLAQIMSFTGPPLNFGRYGTTQFWENAANAQMTRLQTLGDGPTKPILVAGHSYGGAVACVLAAKLLIANPGRDVRLLTFGSPKPGDIRLRELMSRSIRLHFANPLDPVPVCPPDQFYSVSAGPTSLLHLSAWRNYYPPTPRGYLTQNGWVEDVPDLDPLSGIFVSFIRDWAVGTAHQPGTLHSIESYRDNLEND